MRRPAGIVFGPPDVQAAGEAEMALFGVAQAPEDADGPHEMGGNQIRMQMRRHVNPVSLRVHF